MPITIVTFLLLGGCCLALAWYACRAQRKTYQQQQQAAAQWQAAQDWLMAAGGDFWVLDASGRVLSAADATLPLPGGQRDDRPPQPWQQLQAAATSAESSTRLAALLAAGLPFRDEVLLLQCPDGVDRHIALSAVPVVDGEGRLAGYHACGRDVSAAEQRLAALRQDKDALSLSLSRQALTLIDARLAADQAWQAQHRLLANVSHELLTPLHGMLNFAEMARLKLARGDEARVRECLARIAESGSRLQYQLDGLLDLAALGSGRRPFHWQSLNLRLLVENCLGAHEADITRQRLLIELHSHPLPRLVADHGSLSQLLGHLLGNAVRFSPAGGLIRIDIDRQIDRVLLRISDQGPGVAKEDAGRIFDAFERADSSQGHSGLGLAICRRIVEAHGGALQLLPSETGACFELTLPFVAGQRLEPQAPELAQLSV